MDNQTVISKEKYMEILEQQKESCEEKVESAQASLDAIEDAIWDLKDVEFNEVNVTEEDGRYTFSIIELEK